MTYISETILLYEWDYNKNIGLNPNKIKQGSNKKVWWKCNICSQNWKAIVKNRSKGSKCPYCIGRKIYEKNCLSTTHPELIKEWDFSKNIISPNDISFGSHKRVWWKCKSKHEWRVSINNRTSHNYGCPYCTNRKVCEDNCLETNFPKIAKEWNYNKNGDLTPKNVIFGSGKKVWWKCKSGHEWKTTIVNRTRLKNNCPYCCNQKVCNDNCLSTTHPEFLKEWNYIKNKLSPYDVVAGSSKKIWWICKCGHEWRATLKNRTNKNRSCIKCYNNRVSNISQKWLDLLSVPNKFREIKINVNNNKYIFADAFYNNTIYEFYGCFWHGCPICFPEGINKVNKKPFKTLYYEVGERNNLILSSNYELKSIWECDFKER